MDKFAEILKRRSLPGTLIFDLNGKFLYSNRKTLEMIAGLGNIEPAGKGDGPVIPGEVYALCRELTNSFIPEATGNADETASVILTNGSGQAYSLRAFFMGGGGGDMRPSHIMILVERMIDRHCVDLEKARVDFNLSRREADVVKLLCRGDSNKEISDKLFISEYTVKDHIKKVMRKMGVNSRNEILANLD